MPEVEQQELDELRAAKAERDKQANLIASLRQANNRTKADAITTRLVSAAKDLTPKAASIITQSFTGDKVTLPLNAEGELDEKAFEGQVQQAVTSQVEIITEARTSSGEIRNMGESRGSGENVTNIEQAQKNSSEAINMLRRKPKAS